MVTAEVALLGRRKPLSLVHLRADLQALRQTCLLAALLEPRDDGAGHALIPFVALARAILAQSVVITVIEWGSRTGLEAAVSPIPPWITAASVRLEVAHAVSVAVAWAVGIRASLARVLRLAVACAVVALPVRFVASLDACAKRAVVSAKAFLAMAQLCEVITHAIPTAAVGAHLLRRLALQSNKSLWTKALSLVALPAVAIATFGTRLLAASRALEPNLTKARCIIPAVSVVAVRADRLRAVGTTVPNVTLTLARDAIATPVSAAAVRAHLLFTRLPHVTRSAIAHTVHAPAMIGAVAWASLQ